MKDKLFSIGNYLSISKAFHVLVVTISDQKDRDSGYYIDEISKKVKNGNVQP